MPGKSDSSSLHLFADDLKSKVRGNSAAPPRSIRAADLDANFKIVTIIPNDDIPYTVNTSKEGTSITIFPPSPGPGTYYLSITDGALAWKKTGSGASVGSP